MSLVFCASRNVSFNDSNHILKFFTKGFENLPSSFFLIPKTCYQVLSKTCGCIYTLSFIQTFSTRWQIIMVLLLYMKQIFILVKTAFVELIHLSGDLKTINCHINLLGYFKQRSVLSVSAIFFRPDFPCFSWCTPLHFNSIAWVFHSIAWVFLPW